MAYIINQKFKSTHVENFGIGGSGTVHSYLQVKQLILDEKLPEYCIVNYAYFHNMRNSNNRLWRMLLSKLSNSLELNNTSSTLSSPYFSNVEGSLVLNYSDFESQYSPFPFSNLLRTVLVAELLYSIFEENYVTKSDELTFKILTELNQLCAQNNSTLIVINLDKQIKKSFNEQLLTQKDFLYYDLGLNLVDEKYNLQPYDNHPNQDANLIWAEAICSLPCFCSLP